MLDRALAERLAMLVSGGPGDAGVAPEGLVGRVDQARVRVVEVTGMQPTSALPPAEWIDRAEWSRANLGSMAALLDPLGEGIGAGLGPLAGAARAAVGSVASAEVGALLGFLGRRVLGQYDLVLLDPDVTPRLLFVAPNLAEVAASVHEDLSELVAWVAFHEVTHAVQFASVPWLRGHLAALLRELLDGLTLKVDAGALARLPSTSDLRAMADAVREGGLALAVAGPQRRGLLEQVQATMGLVEGHAEWTMDAAARDVLPSLDRLRAALDARRRDRSPMLRLLDRLLGLDLKLRQYQDGRVFCDAVVAAHGTGGLATAWRSPADAPSLDELRDPARWLARQGLRAA
jgi:coenzyme F420 biosynthesis associated uncharacterized protein